MADPLWMLDAKCVQERMDPALFDASNGEPAQLLCAGCPVQVECAVWHCSSINVSEYVERIAGVCPDVEDDIVYPSGVKAAGINLGV